jgi:hypothetical protein
MRQIAVEDAPKHIYRAVAGIDTGAQGPGGVEHIAGFRQGF